MPFLWLTTRAAHAQQDPQAFYQATMQARVTGDFVRYRDGLRQMLGDNGTQPFLLYKLAGAYALLGDTAAARTTLLKLVQQGVSYPLAQDADFASLHASPAYPALIQQFAGNRAVVGNSTVAFTVPQPDLIPEGLAYDPRRGDFYLSSIYRHKVVRIDKSGQAHDFTTDAQDGLGGTLGMKVDSRRKRLWVCSLAGPEAAPAEQGRTALYQYKLRNGRLVRRYEPEKSRNSHLFNDLVIGPKGEVYVTDSRAGTVYRLKKRGKVLEPWLPAETLVYPNGISLSADSRRVYVADFRGITAIDVATGTIKALWTPEGLSTGGVDGLYTYGNSLIAIQNQNPERVVQFLLSPNGDTVQTQQVLEANRPEYRIPTTGTLHGNEFWYIANSQLRAIDERGKLRRNTELLNPTVLRLKLPVKP
ncbi:SMP-30/gluconolactonase/LRE family protein [Hymenobacter sp. BT491]|uniref:SMP-30/gluconolactonase/LRE family protein n=1 Tax=Hymenobacter sp. BT491 TaxID=2766779 RepID=UPI001653A7BE|nr:SMP-30/gluconolactonase/LRE family protein [Hymenobacter sp. BT491]MBC6991657.1 SMP-30/gluconolactonase/LRE family protein [Hymenobacter sp. BT491]